VFVAAGSSVSGKARCSVLDQLRCVRCRFLLLGLFGVALCQFPPADVRAAKFNRVLDHGDKAPVWNDLPGTDGKKHSLRDLKSADVVVVVFFCNHCPVAKAYEQRLLKLAAATKEQSVQFALISVSRYAADNLDEMKKRRIGITRFPICRMPVRSWLATMERM